MPTSPVSLAPPQYAVAPGASPRPDLLQAAGTAALAAVEPAAPAVLSDPNERKIDRDYHNARVEEFEEAEEASRSNREKAERDVDYYDNKQLTEKEFATLQRRGQPPITLNMIRQKIDYLIGLERTHRTKPRALPRTQRHEDDAQSITDALEYVSLDNRYDQIRSRVWTDILKPGWGGVEVIVEPIPQPKPGQPANRVVFRRTPWDRMWWDPYSSEEDYSDAAHRGLVRWIDKEEAVRAYGPVAAQIFDETVQAVESGGTYNDKPKNHTWVALGKRQRIRIVQSYFRNDDGDWEFCEFTKGGILHAGLSPWLDEDGQPECPYEWRSAYVDRDNNRYGAIRDLIDPQDEINKRRSKALHQFTARQTFGTPASSGDVKKNRLELAKPDGHVGLGPDARWGETFGIIPTGEQAQGNLELMTQAMQVFETMGPNAAMMGVKKGDLSGRSVLAQQQGGNIQQGTLTDTLRDLDIGVYRKGVYRIRSSWTGETWVRVTDDEKNLRWVGFNTPAMQPVMVPMFDPQAPGGMGEPQPVMDPQTGQPAMQPAVDPQTGQPILQNSLADLDVDIIIDDAPDAGTMQDEQFALLVQLKQFDANNEIPLTALISAAPNLRNKADILKAIKSAQEQPNPVKEAATQLELADKQAGIEQKKANAILAQARAAYVTEQAENESVEPIHDATYQARDHAFQAQQAERAAEQASKQQAQGRPDY